jgi:hypothetical protein
MSDVHARFAAWVEWLNLPAQDDVGKLIGCSQAMVSALLNKKVVKKSKRKRMGGTRRNAVYSVRMLDLAARIEVASAKWPEGPIRASEWATLKDIDGVRPMEPAA